MGFAFTLNRALNVTPADVRVRATDGTLVCLPASGIVFSTRAAHTYARLVSYFHRSSDEALLEETEYDVPVYENPIDICDALVIEGAATQRIFERDVDIEKNEGRSTQGLIVTPAVARLLAARYYATAPDRELCIPVFTVRQGTGRLVHETFFEQRLEAHP